MRERDIERERMSVKKEIKNEIESKKVRLTVREKGNVLT